MGPIGEPKIGGEGTITGVITMLWGWLNTALKRLVSAVRFQLVSAIDPALFFEATGSLLFGVRPAFGQDSIRRTPVPASVRDMRRKPTPHRSGQQTVAELVSTS